jgi:hypothetical protein
MTHVIEKNRIPLIAVNDPADWSVFRILAPFVYIENDSNILPSIPVKIKCIITELQLLY